MTQLNAFSIDVEDYFQVSAFASQVSSEDWDQLPQRVVANTERLLELLAERQTYATFYVLGWVAERYPRLVQQIAAAGHELASHSYAHRLVYELTPSEFRGDLRRSIDLIEDAGGQPVTAYRAPSFSITRNSMWALEILLEEGITCDSSIFPIVHDRYGVPNARPDIHEIETPSGQLTEFPPTVAQKWGFNIPVSGGGYFRLYPYSWSRYFARQVEQQGRPYMFYVHPWEIDEAQPKVAGISLKSRFRHYVNLKHTYGKLERLLGDFRFGTVAQVLESRKIRPVPCVA